MGRGALVLDQSAKYGRCTHEFFLNVDGRIVELQGRERDLVAFSLITLQAGLRFRVKFGTGEK